MKKRERLEKEKVLRKELILECAMKVFASLGYENSTMNDIAREAGYSKSNMYFYFKNKQEVFVELIKTEMRERKEKFEELLKLKLDPREKINRLIEDIFGFIQKRRDFMCIMHSEQHKLHTFEHREKFRTAAMNNMMETISSITRIFDEGIKSGIFKKSDPSMTGMLFFGMIGSSIEGWFHSGFKLNLDECRKNILDILFTGIARK